LEQLVEVAGDSIKAAEIAGTIKAYRDIINISVEEL
jgi:hypothetical protein